MDKEQSNGGAKLTLKELRERMGWSQEELSRRLGVSFRSVAGWEAGKKVPRFDNAIALARVLGVSLKGLGRAMNFDVKGLKDVEDDD